jgi:mono/diheme cytochrome c family protein
MSSPQAVSRPDHIDDPPAVAAAGEDRHCRPPLAVTADDRPCRLSLALVGLVCLLCLGWNACHYRESPAGPAHFGFGRPALRKEMDSMAIAIRPDGRGLPAGSGDTRTGESIYAVKCAACHGATGREGPFVKLVGAIGDTGKAKTIGNYWPYATTVFDYVRRAMPLNAPGSLSADEVYSLTAYLLSANRIIAPQTVLDAKTLPTIVMPAKKYFVSDERD